MNFLAHLYLSGSNDEIRLGNFIGDFVKGSAFKELPENLQKGVILHREIDRYTDTHEIVRLSKKRLQPNFRHYSGVIADVFYDHFLAKNWGKYHDTPLPQYTEHFYALTDEWAGRLPPKAEHMLKYMIPGNWLLNYRHIEGVDQALTGMSRRTKFESGMDRAANDLRMNYELFEQEFFDFFPELTDHAHHFLKSL